MSSRIFKGLVFLVIVLLGLVLQGAPCAADNGRFIRVGNPLTQFTESEYQAIAENYTYVLFAKFHGHWRLSRQDEAAAELKRRNPDIKVFPYFASTLWFSTYDFGQEVIEAHPEWLLRLPDGSPLMYPPVGYYLDLSKPSLRAWIVELLRGWMEKEDGQGRKLYDGIALDVTHVYDIYTAEGLQSVTVVELMDALGDGAWEKLDAWNEGARRLIKALKDIGVPVIFNGIEDQQWRHERSLELLDDADGAMDEGFCVDRGLALTETALVANIDLMMDPTYDSKVFFEKANVSLRDGLATEERPRYQRFCYGSFLLGYRPGHAYFKYAEDDGYTTEGEIGDGSIDPPEQSLDLGAPVGPYQKDGSVYRRRFERGWVYVNLGIHARTVTLPDETLLLTVGGVTTDALYPGYRLTLEPQDSAFLLRPEDDGTIVAGFSPSLAVAGLPVRFADESLGTIRSRSWEFGDGGTSSELNPSHTFTDSGVTPVSLTVAGDAGSDVETRAIVVNPRLGDVAIDEDAIGTMIPVPLADSTTDWGLITLSVTSSDEALIPASRLAVGGAGTERWIKIARPGNDLFGTATLTLTASDGSGVDATQSFNVTVSAVNDAPVAEDGKVNTPEGTPVHGALKGSDADGDALTFSLLTAPSHGTVVITDASVGTFIYTPAVSEFSGEDRFTFKVDDGTLESDPAAVTVIVRTVNDRPVASDMTCSTREDTPVSGSLVASDADGDPLTFALERSGGLGTVSIDASTGVFAYTPKAGVSGTDSFTYRVSDGFLTSTVASVTVNILPANDAPIVQDVQVSTNEDARTVVIALDGSDSDSGTTLTYSVISPPAHGTIAGEGRVLVYTPERDYNGEDQFTYAASDGESNSNEGHVFIHIAAVNDAPVITDIPAQTALAGATVGPLTFTVSDLETPASSLEVSGRSDNELVVPSDLSHILFGGSGNERTVTVVTVPDQTGVVRITLTVGDGELTASRTFPISVGAVNQIPQPDAGADQTVDEGTLVTLDGTRSSDSEPGALQWQWRQVSGPAVELLTPNASVTRFKAPDVGQDGASLVFELMLTDDEGLSAADDVLVRVLWVNAPPRADAGKNLAVREGQTVTLDASLSSDEDNRIVSYRWVQTAGTPVALSDASAIQPTFQTPDVGRDGETLTFDLTVTDEGGLTSTRSCTVTVLWVNAPPIADAGGAFSVSEGSGVATLDGSRSTDPEDGTPATYRWLQVGGTAKVVLEGADTSVARFTVPDVGRNGGWLTFRLTVKDSDGASSIGSCKVTILWVNAGPTANAGQDLSVDEKTLATLDGRNSSDPEHGTLLWQWRQVSGPSVQLLSPASAVTKFKAPDVGPDGATLVFDLTVTDDEGLTATDSVTVRVLWANAPPKANAGKNLSVREGGAVTLDGSLSSDADNKIASYRWVQTGGTPVTLSDASAIQPTFQTPDVGREGAILVFELTVTDEGGLTSTDTCTVTVLWVNVPPKADAGGAFTVDEGCGVATLDGSRSTDTDDGTPATYQWVQVGGTAEVVLEGADTAVARFTVPDVGRNGGWLTFRLSVKDAEGASSADSCKVTVLWVNAAPTANAGEDQAVNKKTVATLDGRNSTDPERGTLVWQWRQVSGEAVELLTPTSAVTKFKAPDVGTDGATLVFELTVTDDEGLTATDECVVTVLWVNTPPRADAGPDRSVLEGTLVTLNGSNSSDADGEVLSMNWVQLDGPAVTLSDPSATTPTFTSPDVGTEGASLAFELTVEDGYGARTKDSCIVNVVWVNVPPHADAGPDLAVHEGEVAILEGSNSTDQDDGIAIWSWTRANGSLDGLTGNDTARASFTAPSVGSSGGSFVIRLTVTDAHGLRAVDTCTVNVTKADAPPLADAGSDQTVPAAERVTLNAGNSKDAEGGMAAFTWRQLEGLPVTFSDPSAVCPTFEAPAVPTDKTGCALVFEVTVEDASGLQSRDTCVVNLTGGDEGPVADAGPDLNTPPGAWVTLDGSESSDPDDGIASVYWEQVDGPPVELSGGLTLTPSFAAPRTGAGGASLAFRLVVTDFQGLRAEDICIVNVDEAGATPSAKAGSDRRVMAGRTVVLDASGSRSSSEEAVRSSRWFQVSGPSVTISNPDRLRTSFTAPDVGSEGAKLVFRVIVTDERGLRSRDTCTVTVVPPKQAR